MNKIKVKLSLCFNWAPRHEDVLEEWKYSATHSDFDTRWVSVVSFTPRPLYPQVKSSWYPLDRRLGGPQSRSDEEKNFQPPLGLKPPNIQSVAQRYTAELAIATLGISPTSSSDVSIPPSYSGVPRFESLAGN
jgi:hypothetical protein